MEKAWRPPAQSRLLCPHLHLSIQHGSSGILKKNESRALFGSHDSGQGRPNILKPRDLRATGGGFYRGSFPGETESDFEDLLDLIKNLPLSYAHIFPFSSRPGTRAAKFRIKFPEK